MEEDETFQGLQVGFTTGTHMYCYYRDREEDVVKTFHYCVDVAKNQKISMPWSPYFYVTREMLESWIDAGMPTREDIGSNVRSQLHFDELKQNMFFHRALERRLV
jgi:hypothetical protein